MSYCRWSSDNFGCDLYCYESADGFVTHVAKSRHVGQIPECDLSLLMGSEADRQRFVDQHRRQSEWLSTCELAPIGGPCDGETFVDDDLESFLARLIELQGLGYRVPDSVIEDVRDELRERAALDLVEPD